MWEMDHKEGWMPRNWCFWIMVPERTLQSPLDSKEIQTVNPKGSQPWISIGRTNAEAKATILWPPDANRWLTGRDPEAGKEWRQEKGVSTEDEMVGWHYWFNGHEFKQAPGDSEGQGSLACCSPCSWKELRHDSVTKQQIKGRWYGTEPLLGTLSLPDKVLSFHLIFFTGYSSSYYKCYQSSKWLVGLKFKDKHNWMKCNVYTCKRPCTMNTTHKMEYWSISFCL